MPRRLLVVCTRAERSASTRVRPMHAQLAAQAGVPRTVLRAIVGGPEYRVQL